MRQPVRVRSNRRSTPTVSQLGLDIHQSAPNKRSKPPLRSEQRLEARASTRRHRPSGCSQHHPKRHSRTWPTRLGSRRLPNALPRSRLAFRSCGRQRTRPQSRPQARLHIGQPATPSTSRQQQRSRLPTPAGVKHGMFRHQTLRSVPRLPLRPFSKQMQRPCTASRTFLAMRRLRRSRLRRGRTATPCRRAQRCRATWRRTAHGNSSA